VGAVRPRRHRHRLGLDPARAGRPPVPRAASPPEESAAWIASEEDRLFTTLSSERWCEASNAADTDEAAAERVLAAHTARE